MRSDKEGESSQKSGGQEVRLPESSGTGDGDMLKSIEL